MWQTRVSLGWIAVFLSASTVAAQEPWDLIRGIEISENETNGTWIVEKSYPAGLQDQAEFSIRGFYVPVQAQGYVTQFLLVPDPDDCPFCGSSGYGISLEVHMRQPVPDMEEGTELAVRGRVDLVESPETYQAIVLRDAALLR